MPSIISSPRGSHFHSRMPVQRASHIPSIISPTLLPSVGANQFLGSNCSFHQSPQGLFGSPSNNFLGSTKFKSRSFRDEPSSSPTELTIGFQTYSWNQVSRSLQSPSRSTDRKPSTKDAQPPSKKSGSSSPISTHSCPEDPPAPPAP